MAFAFIYVFIYAYFAKSPCLHSVYTTVIFLSNAVGQDDQWGTQDRAHYLDIIETESMRLSKLSHNLLALAALESDSMRFKPQPYRLDRQIRKLVLACEPQWTPKISRGMWRPTR